MTRTPNPKMNHRPILLLLFAIPFLSISVAWAERPRPGQLIGYQVVELDPPAQVKLSPLVEGPLLRGHPMQFRVEIDGTPKPINMWSMRVDYTSPTMTFDSIYTGGDSSQSAVVISDPYVHEPGWESRSISGISLTGWRPGELIRMSFNVRGDAPDKGAIRLEKHPTVREQLAHDSMEDQVTYDYKRVFVNQRTLDMPVQNVSESRQPYVFPTPTPRVLFSTD